MPCPKEKNWAMGDRKCFARKKRTGQGKVKKWKSPCLKSRKRYGEKFIMERSEETMVANDTGKIGKMIDTKAIEEHVRGILEALGDDPDREGLIDTPKRVAKMCEEVFEGMKYTNHEIAQMFDKSFEEGFEEDPGRSGMVVMKDIDLFSYCEHHMALMYDMKATVAYVPHGKVIGLSKIARVCDMVSKRLQLQERIGRDIADIITEITGSPDVAVLIEGRHSCVAARGIRKNNTKTFTSELRGAFRTDPSLQLALK